jgi:Leucine Rich repeat
MDSMMVEARHPLHSDVLNGIAPLEDPRYRQKYLRFKCKCLRVDGRVNGFSAKPPPMNRHSLQHLVDFADNYNNNNTNNGNRSGRAGGGEDFIKITELELCDVVLVSDPSPDGGLNVLTDFFAKSDTALTKVRLEHCDFGSEQEASQLIGAFRTNRTVTDLTIRSIRNLGGGAALGNSLSSLMETMLQLQTLDVDCSGAVTDNGLVSGEGVRAFQPALQTIRTLKELRLSWCRFGDEGIRLLADALAGNTTLEKFDVEHNGITSRGLPDITRLLESTRLQKISVKGNGHIFNDVNTTLSFARNVSRHIFLKDLDISNCKLGDGDPLHIITNALVGNTTMKTLDIHWNCMTADALADIARLLESTRLKEMIFWQHGGANNLFNREDATRHCVTTLRHKNSSVEDLPGVSQHFKECRNFFSKDPTYVSICQCLTRNKQLNRVDMPLLVPPPSLPPQQHQQHDHHHYHQQNAGTMMLKTWHKAIAKFAMVRNNNAGASAIFKLFTARPQLLEKRLKRPPPTAAAAAVADTVSQERKRKRL